jgi:hypothetical protein
MKSIIAIACMLFFASNLFGQDTQKRASTATGLSTAKQAGVKDEADVLEGKTKDGQEKELIFRQSVLDESNDKIDKADAVGQEQKVKLLNNTIKRDYSTQKPKD